MTFVMAVGFLEQDVPRTPEPKQKHELQETPPKEEACLESLDSE